MASYHDPVDSSYFYSTYNPYRFTKARDAGWKHRKHYPRYADPEAFNDQQRARLRSILSQINPKLTPRLRRANTRDVSVQVNPRTDAAVQCALGPRTLQSVRRDSALRRRKTPEDQRSPVGSPKGVRYPRTLAVYSPIAYRSITSFLPDDEKGSFDSARGGPPRDASEEREKENVRVEEGEPTVTKSKQPLTPEASEPVQSKRKARARFQFLEQKYGFYHCRACDLRWESAYVWCVQGTNKVYFKQFCRKCQKEFNPYRVEDITCHSCSKARCSCALSQRHVDPQRPHRQDLCGRCRGKRLSCDSTFSFKYLV